jgi:hypothetical protein
MCKEMPVNPVNRVVDPKRIIGKMEGKAGGQAQGVADPPKMLCQPDKGTKTLEETKNWKLNPKPCSPINWRKLFSFAPPWVKCYKNGNFLENQCFDPFVHNVCYLS